MACRFLLLFELTILALLVLACEAKTYVVGDLAGWDTSADLYSWLENKQFYVGDALWFQYSQYHNINQVDKNGYSNCNASNAILTSSDGNTSVPLTTAGEKYFICGVFSHCLGGLKLKVNVLTKVIPEPPPPLLLSPPSPASPKLSPATPSNLPSNPSLSSLIDGLLPQANGSLDGRRMSHLLLVLCCYIGGLFWVLF